CHQRVRHQKPAATARWKEADAVECVIAEYAILDGQRKPAVEAQSSAAAEADPLNRDTADVDVAARGRGINGDPSATAGDRDARFTNPIVHDADRFGNRHCAVSAWIEHRDLAIRERIVVGGLEAAAWRDEGARVGVVAARRGNKGGRHLRIARRRVKTAREHHRMKCKRQIDLTHGGIPSEYRIAIPTMAAFPPD